MIDDAGFRDIYILFGGGYAAAVKIIRPSRPSPYASGAVRVEHIYLRREKEGRKVYAAGKFYPQLVVRDPGRHRRSFGRVSKLCHFVEGSGIYSHKARQTNHQQEKDWNHKSGLNRKAGFFEARKDALFAGVHRLSIGGEKAV